MRAQVLICFHTLVDLHISQCLPLVHGDKPSWLLASSLLPATAQVDDELVLVAIQRSNDGVKARLAKVCIWEEIGRDDDLLNLIVLHRQPLVLSCRMYKGSI